MMSAGYKSAYQQGYSDAMHDFIKKQYYRQGYLQAVSDTLDKIKTEIEAKCCITVDRENDGVITLHDVFEIIDKCNE